MAERRFISEVDRVVGEHLARGGPSEDRKFLDKLHAGRAKRPIVARRASVPEIPAAEARDPKTGQIFRAPSTPKLPTLRIIGDDTDEIPVFSDVDETIDQGLVKDVLGAVRDDPPPKNGAA